AARALRPREKHNSRAVSCQLFSLELVGCEIFELERQTAGIDGDTDSFQRFCYPGGLAQFVRFVCAENGKYAAARGDASAHAGRSVLDNDAFGWSEAEQFRATTIRFGVRRASLHHIAGDYPLGQRKPGGTETSQHHSLRSRRYNGPAVRWQTLQHPVRAGKNGKIGGIGDLEILDRSQAFGNLCVIELRLQHAQDVDGAFAVRNLKGVRVRDAISAAPLLPTALDSADGADEDAVHVEQKAFCMDDYFACELWHPVLRPRSNCAYPLRPARTNCRAASRIAVTESLEQLSQ